MLSVVKHPSPNTSDFSSFLLQAQATRPKVLAFANSATETASRLKQAVEFGIRGDQITLAALQFAISQTHATGLEIVQGACQDRRRGGQTDESLIQPPGEGPKRKHMVSKLVIKLNGDTSTSMSNFVVLREPDAGIIPSVVGTYVD